MSALRAWLNPTEDDPLGTVATLNQLLLICYSVAFILLLSFTYDVFILGSGEVSIFVVFLVINGALLWLTLARNMQHALRANAFLLLTLLVTLIDLVVVAGQQGEGQIFLIIVPVMALTLLGLRYGIFYSAISILTVIITAILETEGLIPLLPGFSEMVATGANWLTIIINYGLLAFILLLTLQRLFAQNEAVLQREFDSVSELQKEQDQLENLVGQRLKSLQAVNEISQRLTRILDKETLLKTAVSLVHQTVDFSSVAIFQTRRGVLQLTHFAGMDDENRTASQAATEAANMNKTLAFVPELGSVHEGKHAAALPILVEGAIPAIVAFTLPKGIAFKSYDRYLLETIVSQIAVAWQNALIYEQTERQAEYETILAQIGDKIEQATSAEEAIKTAVEELSKTLQANRVDIQIGLTKVQPS